MKSLDPHERGAENISKNKLNSIVQEYFMNTDLFFLLRALIETKSYFIDW